MGRSFGRRWAQSMAGICLSVTALTVGCAPRDDNAAKNVASNASAASQAAASSAAAAVDAQGPRQATLLAQAGAPSAKSAASADATDPALAVVRAAIEDWLDHKTKVDEVRATPVPGVYEVRVGLEFVYVDGLGRHGFIEGDLIDLQGKRNLTRERSDELLAIDFNKDLPFDLALKQVFGNGKRVVAVFEDPNCGYCRNLRSDLNRLKDATVYTFAIPILAADSEVKARKALCAPDKVAAWSELMMTGKVPNNPGTCSQTQMEKLINLGKKLNVSVTPTIFFPSGKRVRGYVPPSEFEKLLEQNKS